jgi:Fe-S-cluster-containing dehydrogenase component
MGGAKKRVTLELTRRDLFKVAGAAVGSAAFAYTVTSGPLSPFSELRRRQQTGTETPHEDARPVHWGMAIDLEKCIGCNYCTWACDAVNEVFPDKTWNIVVPERTPSGAGFFFSRPCLHCQEAPCVEVCPVQATWVRDDGPVMMDYDRCIGCRYCEVACPYDARKFNWEAHTAENEFTPTWGIPEVQRRPRGVVEKCTFCVQRIDRGLELGLTPGVDREATPACVNICPVGARTFGNLNDPASSVSRVIEDNPNLRLREDLGTEPSVYYIPPKEGL